MTAVLETARLVLAPLAAGDADDAFAAFADPGLYELMLGETPADVASLRERFARLAAGCPRPEERWLNWLARTRDGGALVGWHQATVVGARADVAWVTFGAYRRCGYAREGAAAVIATARPDATMWASSVTDPTGTTTAGDSGARNAASVQNSLRAGSSSSLRVTESSRSSPARA